MNTKTAKGVLETAGYEFVKNPCGIGWICKDKADGREIARHNELGCLIQLVADALDL